MKRKTLFILALLCTLMQGALAQTTVYYNVRSWDEVNKKVVSTSTPCNDYTVLEGSHPDDWIGLGGYYVVRGNVSYQTLNCFGNVHLILCDGASLTCTGGIKVETTNSNAKLFIYSQSDGDNEGRLNVTNSYENAAGIGSAEGKNCGEITIHGGVLDIHGAPYGAGIGAGKCTVSDTTFVDDIVIYGGTVTSHGGDSGAGIGGGSGHKIHLASKCKKIIIYDGTVTATGGSMAAGIGGGGSYSVSDFDGKGGNGAEVYIYGGLVTAQGGKRGSGIGGGNNNVSNGGNSYGGKLYVYDGTVNATGGSYGAGIGGGCNSNGADVYISGGIVNATGGIDGAGIGGGEDGNGGTLEISGGKVRAEGRSYGAGIGGGENARGTDVTITGGTVTAIAGDDCKGREAKGGSAIGCGQGRDDKGNTSNCKALNLPDDYMVTAGDAENNIERIFTAEERIAACRWRDFARIEACPHTIPTVGGDKTEPFTYTIDDNTYHTKHCRYCSKTWKEEHAGSVCVCGNEGNNNNKFIFKQAGTEKDTYTEGKSYIIGKGITFQLPGYDNVPEGYTFAGWEKKETEVTTDNWVAYELNLNEPLLEATHNVETPDEAQTYIYYPHFHYAFKSEWSWADDYSSVSLTLSHNELANVVFASDDDSYKLTIEQDNLMNDDYERIGTRYIATCTYTLNGHDYIFTDYKDSYETVSLELIDDEGNYELLEENKNRAANVTLKDRTLYRDGSWNTLCLPFNVTTLSGTPLEGATVKMLASTTYEDNTLTLKFGSVTAITAGYPYIVRWETTGENISDPIFNNVIIKDNGNTIETDYMDCIGFYAPVDLLKDDKTILYLGANNKLYYPSANLTVNSCRAVFCLKNLTADEFEPSGEAGAPLRFVLNFNADEATSIQNVELRMDNEASSVWYSIDGRRLNGKPSSKGLYIHNGRKYVIK